MNEYFLLIMFGAGNVVGYVIGFFVAGNVTLPIPSVEG